MKRDEQGNRKTKKHGSSSDKAHLSQQRLQRMLNVPGVGVLVFDYSGTLLHANDAFLQVLGYQREEFEGKTFTWRDFTPMEHVATSEQIMGQLRETGRGGPIEKEYFRKDGSRVWMMFVASDLGDGTIVEYAIDISAARHAEQALARSEEKFRALFDSIDEGVSTIEMIFDDQGRPVDFMYLEHNPALTRMTGMTDDTLGKLGSEVHPNLEPFWLETYGRTAKTGEPARFEYSARDLDNRWFDVYASRVGGEGSRKVVIVYSNITERKRREANLAFLAEVSEDLVQLTNIDETMNALGAKIAVYLDLSACAFAELKQDAQIGIINYDWHRADMPSLLGTYRMADFVSPEILQDCRAGKVVIIRDVFDDPRTDGDQYAALNIGSFVSMPLVQDGEWRFLLVVYRPQPSDWRDDEIELLREIATRIWARLERTRAEESLYRSQERLRLIIESAQGYAIFTTDPDGFINSWNPGAAHIFGWSEADILGQNCGVLFTPEDRAAGEPQKELNMARARGMAPDIRWHQRQDGSRVFIHGEVRPLQDGQQSGFVKIGRDLTAQRQAEDALRSLNETLEQQVQSKTAEVRQTASELVMATQSERHRISHLLHDDVQQSIYAVQMQMAFLSNILKEGTEAARKEALDITNQISEILEMTRQLSIDLSPPILRGEGLWHAIHWLVGRMKQRYNLPIELQAEGSFILPHEELHVLIFNCVRELLFNVVKHANASKAVVTLEWVQDKTLQIEVRDDGKGFPPERNEQPLREGDAISQSLGLVTIRHQLSLFGGTMKIQSLPGMGTRIIMTVPVPQNE